MTVRIYFLTVTAWIAFVMNASAQDSFSRPASADTLPAFTSVPVETTSSLLLMQGGQGIEQAAVGGAAGGAAGGDEGGPDAGTDPSKAKKRFTLFHEYYNIKGNGFNFNTTTASVTIPILGGGGTFGFYVPFSYADLPNAHPFGIGDIYGRLVLLPTKMEELKNCFDWPFERVTPVIGTDVYFPTADTTLRLDRTAAEIITVSLGTGKYRLAPLAGFVWAVSKEWTVIPIYFQEISVAGDPHAASINTGKLRLFVQYQDPSGWYFKPEFQSLTYYNDHNRTEFYTAPEVGKVFKGGTVFYVKPGYGFIDHDNNRNWGIEAGMRTVF